MKSIISLLSAVILPLGLFAQLLHENFDNGIPQNWTTEAGTSVKWVSDGQLGLNGSGCALADLSNSSERDNARLNTPFMDLTTLANPQISFNVALVGVFFVPPNITLWYDTGNGWNYLHSWGSFSVQTEVTQNYFMPPDPKDLTRVNISHALEELTNESHIRFSLRAEFPNGGWVIVDECMINTGVNPGKNIYTLPYAEPFEGGTFFPPDWDFTTSHTDLMWRHERAYGAFGLSKQSAVMYSSGHHSGEFARMISPWIDLEIVDDPVLTFDVAHTTRDTGQANEFSVWYSLNGVKDWIQLASFDSSLLVTGSDTNWTFYPEPHEWNSLEVDLSSLKTTPVFRLGLQIDMKAGNSFFVDNVRVNNRSVTSADEPHENNITIGIYPNPSNGLTSLRCNCEGQYEIEIFGTDGRLRMKERLSFSRSSPAVLDLQGLETGIYVIHGNSLDETGQFFNQRVMIH